MRFVLVFFAVVLCGCSSRDGVRPLLERLRLVDVALPSKVSLVVLCDPTPFSTCTSVSLRSALLVAAHSVGQRQGRIIVYGLDGVVADREVARYESPVPTSTGDAARSSYAARVEREALAALWRPASSVFVAPPRCSRIAAALTNIAQEPSPAGYEPTTIILSDLRDTDLLGDCRPAPSWESFRSMLSRARLLERGSFPSRVIIAYYHLSQPAEGCNASEFRAANIRDLFRRALEQAGASVTVTGAAPEL